MLSKIGKLYYFFKRTLTRANFYVRLMRLDSRNKGQKGRGLVMIQVDGLAKNQLEKAFQKNRLPFLKSLLEKQKYNMYRHYPGFPSTTPAVQAELLYGVKQAVPGFSFFDKQRQRNEVMLDPFEAQKIEREIASKAKGLLEGGSAYCDIYSGGAEETHFCVADFSPEGLFRHRYPIGFILLTLLNIPALIRMGTLIVLEFFLALFEAVRGITTGKGFRQELQFIPSRVGTCIFLRELAVTGAKIDIARNMPIIHMNFLGYDEQSHRRGPSSNFAHWSLQGIDDAIKRVYRAAQSSPGRDYDVWIYSDHGQENTASFARWYGRTINDAVASQIDIAQINNSDGDTDRRDNVYPGIKPKNKQTEHKPEKLVVSGMGPVGHVYIPVEMDAQKKAEICSKLVKNANVPLAAFPDQNDKVRAFTIDGEFVLPDQAGEIFGSDHQYLKPLAEDFVKFCSHKYAGDIAILGFNPKGEHFSFPNENGSHGGPGRGETDAFAILPCDVHIDDAKGYIRPVDIYNAAQNFRTEYTSRKLDLETVEKDHLRLMTYNVHSCVGLDGKVSIERIARVIAQNKPDIVALQELDHGRKRTQNYNQAAEIAKLLNMEYHFHPLVKVKTEKYGDAILSRLPIREVKKHTLPKPGNMKWLETRGAIEITISVNKTQIRIVNTHLGLTAREKQMQIDYILEKILAENNRVENTVLCGDFNFSPKSSYYKKVTECLDCKNSGEMSFRTWPSRYPLARIDHVFFKGDIEIITAETPRNDLAEMASDHLPIVSCFRVPPGE